MTPLTIWIQPITWHQMPASQQQICVPCAIFFTWYAVSSPLSKNPEAELVRSDHSTSGFGIRPIEALLTSNYFYLLTAQRYTCLKMWKAFHQILQRRRQGRPHIYGCCWKASWKLKFIHRHEFAIFPCLCHEGLVQVYRFARAFFRSHYVELKL